jgi:outer membrane protein insertion porin family
MHKILFQSVCWLFLATVSFSSQAIAADKIMAISIEGNRYVETAAVLENLTIKTGDTFSLKQISRNVRKLFATGFFSDVYTEGERISGGIKLIFVVEENPVIASVSIEGESEFREKKLRPLLEIKPGRILSPQLERKDLNTLKRKYLSKGYYQSEVNLKTTVLEDGRVDVVFEVEEGEVTLVKDIRFIGNERFSDTELLETLASRESGLGSWFSDSDVFNRKRFDADAQMVQVHYLEHGYLDVSTLSTRLMLAPNLDGFYLTMSLHEGDAFTVSGIELQGDLVPSKQELMDAVKLEQGKLYALSKMQKTIAGLTELVGDQGFAFATVAPSFHRDLEHKTVVVIFDIEKGREVYVDRINISGNAKTKSHVIRRELRQHEGERYKASNIRRGKERVARLSYLKNTRLSKQKTDSPNQVHLDLNVEEGKSGSFSGGISYSAQNKLGFQGKVTEKNFLGEGYNTSLNADVGGASNNYSFSFSDPYFIWDDVSGSFSLFRRQTNLQSYLDYQYDSNGGSVGLGIALSEYARYSLSYSITNTTLRDVPATSSIALRSQEGTYETGEFSQSISYDTRNRTFAPSEGGLQRLSFSFAGLTGDHKFYETTFSSKNYYPISDFWTLRGVLSAGSIHGYGGLDVPIYRRYSLGGVASLRGYDIFGVSLVDPSTLDVLGGQYKTTSSIDLLFPLPFMESAGFRGTFFVDAGTVWGDSGVVSEPFNLSNIRASYGFGIEWASPVGPITLTWGYPLNAKALDKERSFEFGLGQGF